MLDDLVAPLLGSQICDTPLVIPHLCLPLGSNATLDQLRSLPAYVVRETSAWLGMDPGVTAFSPNIDNYVIPQVVPSVFNSGRQARVPLLAGFNAREDTLFQQRAFDHSSATAFNERLLKFLNMASQPEATLRAAMSKYYPATSDAEATESSFRIIGDLVIAQQTWEAVHEHQKTSGQPSWLYTFNFTSEFSPVAGHGPVGGPEVLDANEAYFLRLRDLARQGIADGATPLELARAAGPGPFGRLLDAERLVPNLHRAYAEERGAAPGDPLDVPALFREMTAYHGGLPTCRA